MSDPARVEIPVEVRYAETDRMGVVHHSRYLPWFELARTRLCARCGHEYREIEERGYYLIVSRAELKYRKGAHYGETVTVACWIDGLASRGIRFAYEVRRGEELLVTGTTEHLWVESGSGRPCRTPEFLREPFRRLAGNAPP